MLWGVLGGMPGGRRTDRISKRDLEVLEFVARFGVVSRRAVSVWAATGRTVTITRESRLRGWGLVEVQGGVGELGALVIVTSEGLHVAGRANLRAPRFSLSSVVHECAVAEAAAVLERSGWGTLSEREIVLREKEEGRGALSAELPGGRVHRADLVRWRAGDRPDAVEVELVAKGSARLDELLRGWRRAVGEGRFGGVVYRCAPRVGEVVARAVERTRTGEFIRVEGV
jgi:hypothetical protein